ncbi:hypothetical protein GCM10023196_101870 [Actinoallomurus vinaceus]|uniref:Uncharacterized protein n=1 Tax=Actinoallomurus vinaceus TaxID=1080074 RepID=A0ABP8UUW3_9ACTN
MADDADVAGRSEEQAAEDTPPEQQIMVGGLVGVVGLAYRTAARHLVLLLVPSAVVLVPVGLVTSGLLIAVVGRNGLIANDGLAPLSTPYGLIVAAIAAVVLGIAGYLLALAATVVMSAGLLLGRPVGAAKALAAAVRRPVTLSALGGVAIVGTVLTFAFGLGVAIVTKQLWFGAGTFVFLLVSGLWQALALPISTLEGRGARWSIGRAHSVSQGRRTRTVLAVLLGVVLGPILLLAGLRWALSPLDGFAHVVIGDIVLGFVGLLVVPFQAGTVAVAALNQEYPVTPAPPSPAAPQDRPGIPLDLARIRERLSSAAASGRLRPRRAALLLPLLALPGLLYGGYVWFNPLGLSVDHVLQPSFNRTPVTLHLLGGERPMEITGGGLTTRVCGDRLCRRNRLYDYRDGGSGWSGETGSVSLPDGTVATAAWRTASSTRVLRLFPCGPDGCGGNGPIDTAPIVERNGHDGASAAMTTTGDGIVIAAMHDGNSGGGPEVRLIHCADIRCQKPRAVTVDRLGWRTYSRQSSPLAVAVRRDGRPVVAVADGESSTVTVISCDGPECRHPRLTRPVPPPAHSPGVSDIFDDRLLDGVKLVIPRDDRPVLAYTDPGTGAARLVRCRTPDCATADGTALTGPGLWHTRPAVELDGDRPLVATYDLRRKAAVLIDCQDLGCTHRRSVVLGTLKNGPGYLDLAVGGDRRPRVLWGDQSPGLFSHGGPLHLTTCGRPRCGG